MLPSLPKKRKHKEADVTPLVLAWFRDNWMNDCAIEVKIKGNKPKPHQRVALNQVVAGTFMFKIPDTGRIQPFDGVVLRKADALVVTVDGRYCEVERLNDGEEFSFYV